MFSYSWIEIQRTLKMIQIKSLCIFTFSPQLMLNSLPLESTVEMRFINTL